MSDENYMEMEGVVDSICRDKFTVVVNDTNDMVVICTVSGKIRTSGIKILAGDSVKLLVSAHDVTKGRIVYRMKASQ
jgi:translation initiation factor IF-1